MAAYPNLLTACRLLTENRHQSPLLPNLEQSVCVLVSTSTTVVGNVDVDRCPFARAFHSIRS